MMTVMIVINLKRSSLTFLVVIMAPSSDDRNKGKILNLVCII